jgi:hypothetical protein
MKIDKITPLHLRNDAHFQFFTEFRDLFVDEKAAKLGVKPLFDEWLELFAREDEALKKIVKSEFTSKIHEADKARDEIFTGMTDINKGSLKHYDEKAREAAERLKILFDTYGKIDKKTLNEQTGAVTNILQELKGQYAADAAAVGIDGWVEELQTRNIALETLIKERFDEAASKTDIVVKDARAEVDKQYKAITERINALIIVEGPEKYEEFVKTLNVIIAKYAAGLGRGKKKSAGDGGG